MKLSLVELLVVLALIALVLLGTMWAGGAVHRTVTTVQSRPAFDMEKAWQENYEGHPARARAPRPTPAGMER